MNTHSSDNYLVDQVMTAAPQKLQLMLIDAAIRQIHLAKNHWQDEDNKQAEKHILHAQRIVTGLVGGIDFETKSDLTGKVAGVYLFVCNALTRAFVDNDENKLAEALRVLGVERETWRQVCDKLATSSSGQTTTQTGHAPIAPIPHLDSGSVSDAISSLSLEA
jgi:flagellar secretion chaperone FliS